MWPLSLCKRGGLSKKKKRFDCTLHIQNKEICSHCQRSMLKVIDSNIQWMRPWLTSFLYSTLRTVIVGLATFCQHFDTCGHLWLSTQSLDLYFGRLGSCGGWLMYSQALGYVLVWVTGVAGMSKVKSRALKGLFRADVRNGNELT